MIRTTIAAALLTLCGLLLTQQPAAAQKQKPAINPSTAPYVHSVIFYLKKDAPVGEVQRIIDGTNKLLRKIPTVRGLWVGKPAEKSTPKVAVTDYEVGLLVLFDDAAGLQTYLDHPLHLEFVEKYTKQVGKVLVYDFMNRPAK